MHSFKQECRVTHDVCGARELDVFEFPRTQMKNDELPRATETATGA
jgi:hypothetical protein